MSQLRGIEADFATWRPVQGRKVLQLVFEVPIERTQHVLDMLGIPQPGASKWCAIALLNEKAPHSENVSEVRLGPGEGSGDKPGHQASEAGGSPKKPFSIYLRSQRAAMLCGDEEFHKYFEVNSTVEAVTKLKEHFRIKSRKEFDTDLDAANRWDEFFALYNLHREKHR